MSVTIAIRKDVEVSDDLLAGIICTAVEGGINYWAAVSGYTWHDPVMDGEPHFAEVKVHELDEETGEYKDDGVLVTMAMIADALRKIASDEEIEYAGQNWRINMIDAMIEGDGGMIDAGDADNIVQVALFGKLVYG